MELITVILLLSVIIYLVQWVIRRAIPKDETEEVKSVAIRMGYDFYPEVVLNAQDLDALWCLVLAGKGGLPEEAGSEPASGINGTKELFHRDLVASGATMNLRNVVQGKFGNARVRIFLHRFHHRQRQAERQNNVPGNAPASRVVLVESVELPPADFAVCPKFARNYILLGDDPCIQIPEDPEFDKAYDLQGENAGLAKQVFGQTIRSFFVKHEGLCAELRSKVLLVYRYCHNDPKEIPALVKESKELYKHLASANIRLDS